MYITSIQNYAREINKTSDFKVLKEWNNVLKRQPITSGTKKPNYTTLREINADCNNKAYKSNLKWPTPEEFKASDSADCKGFSVCKYYALRKAGWKPSQLNLWSGDYKGKSHMILVVELDNEEYVLDIGAEANLPHARDYFYKDFMPSWRFNENGWDVN
jgi:predicted transglutaminase-like cysteine proteinase